MYNEKFMSRKQMEEFKNKLKTMEESITKLNITVKRLSDRANMVEEEVDKIRFGVS